MSEIVQIRDLKVQRFGVKLRALRMQHRMNLVELAYALGYAGSGHVSQIETGRRGPTVDLVLKVSKLFDVSADVLLDDEQELNP
jgi:transcriptional regulator with XRE-family HTH domain